MQWHKYLTLIILILTTLIKLYNCDEIKIDKDGREIQVETKQDEEEKIYKPISSKLVSANGKFYKL